MQEPIKPIKRSKELTPLSKDHHEGLLLVWKIRKGIQKEVVADRITRYVKWFWQQHLDAHFIKEEQLFPDVLPEGHPLMQQMFEEHKLIRAVEMSLEQEVSTEKLERFAGLLHDHIRFEERQLFNEVEKASTPEQLEQMAKALDVPESCDDWKDAFWM